MVTKLAKNRVVYIKFSEETAVEIEKHLAVTGLSPAMFCRMAVAQYLYVLAQRQVGSVMGDCDEHQRLGSAVAGDTQDTDGFGEDG